MNRDRHWLLAFFFFSAFVFNFKRTTTTTTTTTTIPIKKINKTGPIPPIVVSLIGFIRSIVSHHVQSPPNGLAATPPPFPAMELDPQPTDTTLDGHDEDRSQNGYENKGYC